MTQEHPIAPPSEDHVLKWSDEWFEAKVKHMTREKHLCMQAARWGADQELEACCEWLASRPSNWESTAPELADDIRAHRRPKPPSLKEQALKELAWVDKNLNMPLLNQCDAIHTIRRALESLPE